MMKNILIFGSCVSRDAFASVPDADLHCVDYFARSSIASAFAPLPAPVGPWIDNIQSSFQRRTVIRDFEKFFCKTFPTVIQKTDILLVDLIDERFALHQRPDGSYVTISNELKNTAGYVIDRGRIPSMSTKFYTLWESGWQRFHQMLKKNDSLVKLRINKVFWAQSTQSGKDFSPNFSTDQICRANNFLHMLYTRMGNDIPSNQFFEFPSSLFVGDDFHKWGLSPFHYIPEYYQMLIKQLETTPQETPKQTP